MRKVDLLDYLEVVAAAQGDGRGGPFPHAIHRQDQGFVKRGWEESTGRVALMVFGEKELGLPIEIGSKALQILMEQTFLEKLFANPQRDGHLERTQAPWREGQISFEQTLELQERFVVKDDVVDVIERHAVLSQAVFHSVLGEPGIVFLSREPFFLGRCDDFPIAYECRGA